jgi:P-type conjugative transfer protein TrbJ
MKNLIAKIVLFFFLLFVPFSVSAGGIPVFDGVNLSQNMLAALENIMQTLKQIEEYKTQLDQYQRQLEDARNFDLSDFLWDQADQTIAAMLDKVGTVNQIKDLVNDVNFYKNAIDDGLTISEINAIYDKVKSKLKIENTSIGELIDTVDDQQKRIAKDANILVRLQKKVQSAGDVGQLQAIQSANMLASHMSNQLLQIRALMAAQSNIEAAYKLKLNEQEAKMNAVRKSIREGKYIPSTPVSF